jgi:hypothetical protein
MEMEMEVEMEMESTCARLSHALPAEPLCPAPGSTPLIARKVFSAGRSWSRGPPGGRDPPCMARVGGGNWKAKM